MYVGVPTDPPLGTPAADRPTHLPPPPPPRPPKVFAPSWGLEFEQAAPPWIATTCAANFSRHTWFTLYSISQLHDGIGPQGLWLVGVGFGCLWDFCKIMHGITFVLNWLGLQVQIRMNSHEFEFGMNLLEL